MLQPFFLEPRKGSDRKGRKGGAYKCEKRLKRKKERKKLRNKGAFLLNPKGYFLAFSSLGKAIWDFRSGKGWWGGGGGGWGSIQESPLVFPTLLLGLTVLSCTPWNPRLLLEHLVGQLTCYQLVYFQRFP